MHAAASVPPPDPAAPHVVRTSHGRLRDLGTSDGDRNLALLTHLCLPGFFIFQILPLVALLIWALRKDRSAFIDDHGREVANVIITALIGAVLCLSIVFIPFYFIWVILTVISSIRAAIASGRSEYFRYPMTLRLLQ